MTKTVVGLFVGVFVGALVYEVIKKGEFARRAARRVSDGVQAARHAFDEGYRSVQQPSEGPLPSDAA